MANYDDSLDDFDPGIGVPGPWLGFHPLDNRDRTILAGNWSLREAGGKDEPLELKQMVVDWPTSRTGWIEDTGGVKGVTPRKVWNVSRSRPEKAPIDADWKRAFQIRVALAPDQQALWEQGGFGVYLGYVDVMRLIQATAVAELPKLPLLGWTGKREVRTGSGPTLVAVFDLLRYVPPPTCLLEMRALEAPATTAAPKLTAGQGTAPTPSPSPPAPVSGTDRERINREIPIARWEPDEHHEPGNDEPSDEPPF